MATERKKVSNSAFEDGLFELDGATEYKNIMVHGDPGCGKTVLTGTLPGRVLWLAGEPGYISAGRTGARGKVRIIPDTAMALAAIDWLEAGNASKFDWIVPEGLLVMQNKFLLGYAAEAFDANPAKRAHRNLPDKPDYFNAQNFMKGWISRFVDLPCNVLFTTHSLRPENENGETLVTPGIQGKGWEVSSYIAGLMHAVGYMSIRVQDGEQVRRILWQQYFDERTDTRYIAKDQFNALPMYTDNWTMPQILQRIDETPAPAAESKKAKKGRK